MLNLLISDDFSLHDVAQYISLTQANQSISAYLKRPFRTLVPPFIVINSLCCFAIIQVLFSILVNYFIGILIKVHSWVDPMATSERSNWKSQIYHKQNGPRQQKKDWWPRDQWVQKGEIFWPKLYDWSLQAKEIGYSKLDSWLRMVGI